MKKHIVAIDHLRGLMALTVMLYHYHAWQALAVPSAVEPALKLMGMYAVATFYVISGIALSVAYGNAPLSTVPALRGFAIKRFFRLAPLMWVATGATLLLIYVGHRGDKGFPGLEHIALNLSLLFGVFDHARYIATGAWSIGNEVVFYLLFPLVLWASSRAWGYAVALLVSVAASLYFALYAIDGATGWSKENWSLYINPFNQLFLFVAGVGVGLAVQRLPAPPKAIGWTLLGSAALGLWLLADRFTGLAAVTGWPRYALATLCILLCYACTVVHWGERGPTGWVLGMLGATSYSIYLLHPVVFVELSYWGKRLGYTPSVAAYPSIAATLGLAYLSYRFVEAPMIRLGRRIPELMRRDEGAPAASYPRT